MRTIALIASFVALAGLSCAGNMHRQTSTTTAKWPKEALAPLTRDELAQLIKALPALNKALKAASDGKLKGIMDYTEDDVVSVDFNHYPASATVDSKMTKVLENNFAKVIAWYDNEWGYSCRVVDLIEFMVKKGL